MSGHSKWSSIKHKKAITDAKRSQLFSKLSKDITIAARNGADPKMNVALANAIDRAKAMNMPNDNIDRAIKKVSDKDSNALQEFSIEAIFGGTVALRIKGVTDNSNRTINEIKRILSDHNAKMVPPGSIAWMFGVPVTVNEATNAQVEKLFETLDDHDDVSDVDSNLAESESQS